MSVFFVDEAMVEFSYQKIIDGAHGETKIILAVERERQGGPCPLCGVPFVRRDIANLYGLFHYFYPGCHCFNKHEKSWHRYYDAEVNGIVNGWRPGCGRYMIAEKLLGLPYCTNCQTHDEKDEFNGRVNRHQTPVEETGLGKRAPVEIGRSEK